VLFDRRYPSFRNFDSTISFDVIRMKSHMDTVQNNIHKVSKNVTFNTDVSGVLPFISVRNRY